MTERALTHYDDESFVEERPTLCQHCGETHFGVRFDLVRRYSSKTTDGEVVIVTHHGRCPTTGKTLPYGFYDRRRRGREL